MNISQIRELVLRTDSLAPHVDAIIAMPKPCVEIELTADPLTDACSRFGGCPFVPVEFEWPKHPEGEYRFLGQINFSEIADVPSNLPKHGLLSLFYAYDEDGEIFWQDDAYICGYFWDKFDDHILCQLNPGNIAGIRLSFKSTVDIPVCAELFPELRLGWSDFADLRDAIGYPRARLLGYPQSNTLGYDPTPGPAWTQLLQVTSYDEFDWCWHDSDQLMVFIEIEKLAECRFDALKADAG